MSVADIVVQTEHLAREASTWLAGRCKLIVCAYADPTFADVLAGAAGLVVRTYTDVDEKLLRAGTKLRVVGRAGAGLDNIDLGACRVRGIEVVYTPDANTQAVVEYVVGLLADVLRPRITLSTPVDRGQWKQLRAETLGRRQMSELTLGILGLGRVGKRLAEVARALGCPVIYNDLLDIPPNQRFGAEPVPVDRLFEHSDVISVHIDGRESNQHFVGAELLRRMKSDVILINTSRGFVVDSAALAAFLGDHPQAQALLDVHDREPFDAAYPLLGLPNARLYPHLASRTERAMLNMSWVVRDVVAVLEGREPQFSASHV